MGYPSALSAKTWGFYDVLFKGKAFSLPQPFGSYVMENVLFKISYPAEFHAQTAVEAAMTLHPQVKGRLADIERILIETQEPGVRIIDKVGPLANPADRDHCIQYMVAVPLIFGRLTAADYEDAVAADARIDALRERMQVRENPTFTREYYDPDKRYIGNAVQCSSATAATARACRSISRSATASAAPRACRCWSANSPLRWMRISRRSRPSASRRCSPRPPSSMPCR